MNQTYNPAISTTIQQQQQQQQQQNNIINEAIQNHHQNHHDEHNLDAVVDTMLASNSNDNNNTTSTLPQLHPQSYLVPPQPQVLLQHHQQHHHQHHHHQHQHHNPHQEQTQEQQYHASHGHYSANGTANASHFTVINTDHISEARRKMNTLIHTQTRALDELKNATQNLDFAKQRLDNALRVLEETKVTVRQGAEDLTEALLQEPTHWNAMYRRLVEYKEKYGDVEVKRVRLKGEKEVDPETAKLGPWIGRVRLEARKPIDNPDRLEPYKIIALDRLGFDWDPRENYWLSKFEELKVYIENHPKSKMPTRKSPLGVWCDGQVLEYNRFMANSKPCYITQDRIDKLNSIGFIWDRMASNWNESYAALKKYYKDNGHCHIPVNYTDKTLFRWIAKQRKKHRNYKQGKKPALTEEQIELLEKINFFEPAEERIAKYTAQKEKERRALATKVRIRADDGTDNKRGRPKAKTLIPEEAQELMAPRLGSLQQQETFTNSLLPGQVNYPAGGTALSTSMAGKGKSDDQLTEHSDPKIDHLGDATQQSELLDDIEQQHEPLEESHEELGEPV